MIDCFILKFSDGEDYLLFHLSAMSYICSMQQMSLFITYFIAPFLILQGQSAIKNYTKSYFRWPLDLKPEIVANLGELRNNHWHMGLDIRTDQKENQPVYAAAAGYIARIRIEPFGFGRSIFINHPNGLTTLYAHLNDFFPELEKYVKDQQYQQQSWAIELNFSPKQFPVAKGKFHSAIVVIPAVPRDHMFILKSGIQKQINASIPLLFGFPLFDQVPPTMVKLAMYDRSFSLYEQTPQFFAVKKTDSGYIIPKIPILKTGLKKSVLLYRLMTGSTVLITRMASTRRSCILMRNRWQGLKLTASVTMETGYMNAHIDYRYKHNGGPYLQHLSQLPGDFGPAYKQYDGDGTIYLNDTNVHSVRIEITDAYSNRSELNFFIQNDQSLARSPAHSTEHSHFRPGMVNILERKDFEIYLPEDCLYDTIPVLYYTNNRETDGSVSLEHAFNNPSIPVHNSFTVRIKPTLHAGFRI